MSMGHEEADYSQLAKNHAENSRRAGQLMRAVRDTAVGLVKTHPAEFDLSLLKNGSVKSVTAKTEFEDGPINAPRHLGLSLSVAVWPDGKQVSEICISLAADRLCEDIFYRLSIVQGEETKRSRQATSERIDSESRLGKEFQQAMLGSLGDTFEEIGDGDLASLDDGYAETKITTLEALTILRNARNLHRPASFGSESVAIPLLGV